MEVERRIYDVDIEEFERYEDGFDDFLMKYLDDNDEYSQWGRKFNYEKESKILKNLFHKINVCTKNREFHAMNYIDIMNKLKKVVIDVSDACFIQVDALELISQAKHHSTYSAIIDFLVQCHYKRNLKVNFQKFDKPVYKFGRPVEGDMGSVVDAESKAESALQVIDQYNKHKGAKLKLVCMTRVNVLFGYLIYYYITFTAVDEDTGCIGTYQAALVKRGSVCIIGLFRDANAHKTLSLLSIKGAEEEVNYKLNHRGSFLR